MTTVPASLLLAASAKPAGGAALGQIAIATGAAIVVTTALLVLGIGHRNGRNHVLAWGAHTAERTSGLPGWAALPAFIATLSLITAVFGMYWDISLHIDVGRDPGPLANPAHYFILAGLFGIFAAGFVAMVLPRERPSGAALRITGDWYAPLGGVLICACGAFSLLGFPLDDMWHRLFGQDVTLWGPTHLMLIGGAAMTLLGIAVLLVEGLRANAVAGRREESFAGFARRAGLTGGLLLGLSTFQGEFDFGVPQFRFVFAPLMVMFAAGLGLVLARAWLGRGSALLAVAFFLVIRGGLALLIGGAFGEATPHFPLYVVEALVVEGVALVVSPRRRLPFAVVAGVGVGTLGLAAEWAWSATYPIPWDSALFPEGAVFGLLGALAGGLLGAWAAARLSLEPVARSRSLRTGAVVGAVAIGALVLIGLHKPPTGGLRARVALTNVRTGTDRTVNADVRITPPAVADGAEWFTATAWQGGGLVVDRLRRVARGHWRTTQAIPVHGNWKAMIRLHTGASLMTAPIYLPDDPAIPARGLPARAHFDRAFVPDQKVLQREQKGGSPGLWVIAYGVVAAIALGLLALLAWGLHRLSVDGEPRSSSAERRARSSVPAPA